MNVFVKSGNLNVHIYIPFLSFSLSILNSHISHPSTFTTLNLFLPRQHPALQILCIGETHHFQDLAGLPASVSAAAV